MRPTDRACKAKDEEDSVFVSMTDMMVSFLFIMLLLVAFFAVNYSEQKASSVVEEVIPIEPVASSIEIAPPPEKILEDFNTTSQLVRQQILRAIEDELRSTHQDMLDRQNILVEVSGDALRFKGVGLFDDNSDILTGDRLDIVRTVGNLTLNAIECYTINAEVTDTSSCNPTGVMVEAVQIEGHTDDVGSNNYNLKLSSNRAQSAFFAMEAARPDILSFKNSIGQPVISVAGYGEMRPIAPNTPENRSENRRVDLRIIMHTPASVREMLEIRNSVTSAFDAK